MKKSQLELIEAVYKPVEIPKCYICGETMTCQDSKNLTFACTGLEDDPNNAGMLKHKEGRSFADDHYKLSRRSLSRLGDSNVYELLQEYKKLKEEIKELRTKVKTLEQDDGHLRFLYD